MKSALFAVAAFGALAISAPAMAADVPVEQSYPAATVGYYNWTGAYFGLHTGYSFGNVETTSSPTVGAFDTDYDLDFLLGGVTLGYNHQFDRFIIGGEVDASFTDAEESIDPDGGGGVTEFQSDLDWLATARLRVGYAFDNILIYATAGGAAGETDDQIDTGAGLLNERRSRKGWTAGAGFEWGITDNWTAKGEYLYVDLGEETVSNNGPIVLPGAATSVDFEHVYHLGRVGVNYRF